MIQDLPQRLTRALQGPSPHRAGSARLAPQLAYGRHRGPAPSTARPAAVLLLLFPRQGDWQLPLTVRQPHLAEHAGQISLPGGMLEASETSQAGAIRELSEELGIEVREDQLLGHLTPLYVFNSNFLVTPWLAHLPAAPTFQPNAAEVADVFELSLSRLMDPASQTRMQIQHGKLQYWAPCIRCRQHAIWGATGIILGEFRDLLQTVLAATTISPGSCAEHDL